MCRDTASAGSRTDFRMAGVRTMTTDTGCTRTRVYTGNRVMLGAQSRFIMAAGRMWEITAGFGRQLTNTGPHGSSGVTAGTMRAGHRCRMAPCLWTEAGRGAAIDLRRNTTSVSASRSSYSSATDTCGSMITTTTPCAAKGCTMRFGRARSTGFIVTTMADSSMKGWIAGTWNI